jgi:hypothetical protein
MRSLTGVGTTEASHVSVTLAIHDKKEVLRVSDLSPEGPRLEAGACQTVIVTYIARTKR